MRLFNFYTNQLLAVTLFMFISAPIFGQGRRYIKEQIRLEGECRNVAITKTNGDLMLYGRNGCARSGCPSDLDSVITDLNNHDKFIDDIQLTENGRWLILYDDNGLIWYDIPHSLKDKLHQYNENDEVIFSVTFNDKGEWIAITDKHYSSSDSHLTNWLNEGEEELGELWSACITDDGLVAVYAKGYKYRGKVPGSLEDALRETSLDVYRVKIAGEAWFFADKKGHYSYDM